MPSASGAIACASVLVVGEVALALVLLSRRRPADAQLLPPAVHGSRLRPARHAHLPHQSPGAPSTRATRPQAAFYRRALDRIRALPGVTAAGAAQIFPLAGDDYILSLRAIGQTAASRSGNQPSAAYYAATPGYFRRCAFPSRGRDFTEHDNAAAPPVAIISESMARQFYANENPLGQRIQMGNGSKPAEIVGIAGDVRDQELETKGRPAVYEPAAQVPFGTMYFGVRAAGDPGRPDCRPCAPPSASWMPNCRSMPWARWTRWWRRRFRSAASPCC